MVMLKDSRDCWCYYYNFSYHYYYYYYSPCEMLAVVSLSLWWWSQGAEIGVEEIASIGIIVVGRRRVLFIYPPAGR